MINCLNSEIVKELRPLPNASNTPEITTPIVDTIKLNEIILKPLIPIFNNSSVALNHDKIGSGKTKKRTVPKDKIIPLQINFDNFFNSIKVISTKVITD